MVGSLNAQVVEWVQTYPIGHGSTIKDAVPMPGGGYLLVGHALIPVDSGNFQGIVVRTDDNGQLLWWRMYGGLTADLFKSVAMIGDQIWVGGTFDSTGSGWYISTLWRVSTGGDSLGMRRYPGLYNAFEKVRSSPDGNLLVTTSMGAILAKIDQQGNIVWSLDGPEGHGGVSAFDVRANGTILVACQNTTDMFSDTLAINVYWVGSDGQVQTMRQHYPPSWGGPAWAGAEDVIAVSDTDAVVAGWIQTGSGFFAQSPYLFRIGRSGYSPWYSIRSEEFAYQGLTASGFHDSLQIVTWKPFTEAGWANPVVNSYDLDGNYSHGLVVDVTPGQSAYVFVSATAEAPNNRLLVMGSRDLVYDTSATQSFCAQASFGPSAVRQPNLGFPDDFELSIYPNPFNSQTTLTLEVPREGRIVVKMYDVMGREVETVVDRVMAAGEQRFVIDGSRYPTGLYFVRATQTPLSPPAKAGGEFVQTRKLMLLK